MTARRGLFWPLVLIAVGTIFLLANYGFLGRLSLVALLSLWPLILILAGIDIAFGRRWPVQTLIADVVLIGAGLALVATNPSLPSPFFIDSSLGPGESAVSVPRIPSTDGMRLRLSGGAGIFTVHGATLADEAVHATSDRGDLRLRGNTRVGTRADVRIDQVGFEGLRFGPSSTAHVDYAIANDIPTSLQLDSGAGEFTIDLTDVKVTDATVNVGAAALRLVLPKPTGDIAVTVSAGASSIVIEVPSGVEARVTTSGGLLSTHYDPRFTNGETSGYASAKDRVTVRVSAGATSVTVR
jgi:hypothetical protein